MIHSGVVHVAGDRATACWWFSETKLPVGGGDWLTMIGVYQDESVRRPEGWRFARRIQTTVMEHRLQSEANVTLHRLPEFSPIAGLPVL